MTDPTQTQFDQAADAQAAFEVLIDNLIRDGIDYAAILSGAGTALAHSITVNVGPDTVPVVFAQWSAISMWKPDEKRVDVP